MQRDIVPKAARPAHFVWPIVDRDNAPIGTLKLRDAIREDQHVAEFSRLLAVLEGELREIVLARLDQDERHIGEPKRHTNLLARARVCCAWRLFPLRHRDRIACIRPDAMSPRSDNARSNLAIFSTSRTSL